MKFAPNFDDEEQRLINLRKYDLLDSDKEDTFDSLVRLASKICDVPISLITLLDNHRQWFKASVGISVQETPRDISFCTHAIEQPDAFFVVEHASQDERFKDNPLVTGYPSIEFYAGKPILSPEGYPFGTLCVIDTKPRKLTGTQLEMLGDLVRQVEVLLELKVKKMELQQSNYKLEERTDLLRTFFEVSQDLIGVIQPTGELIAWNHSWSDELLFDNDEIRKLNVWNLIHPDDLETTKFEFQNMLTKGTIKLFLNRFSTKNGDYIYIEWNATFLNGKTYAVGRNVTQEVLKNQEFAKNKNYLSTLISSLPDLLLVIDQEGTFLNADGALQNVLIATPEQMLGKKITDFLPISLADKTKSFIQKALQGDLVSFEYDLEVDGTHLEFEARFKALSEDQVLVLIRDITQQKRSQRELLKSQEKLKAIVDSTNDAVFAVDTKMRYISFNQRHYQTMKKIYGVEVTLGQRFTGFFNRTDVIHFLEENINQALTGKFFIIEKDFSNEFDETFFYEFSFNPIRSESNVVTGVAVFIRDISARIASQDEIKHLSEMQKVLMEISTNFINSPIDQVDQSIDNALGFLGKFVNADRCYIFDYLYDENISKNTYEWCAEGIPPEIHNLQALPLIFNEEWFANHTKGTLVYIENVLALPPSLLREILEPQGIKSLITIPMMQDGHCLGFVGFDFVRSFYKYNQKEQQLLEVFSAMLVNVTARVQTFKHLKTTQNRLKSIFDEMNDAVWSAHINYDEEVFFTPSLNTIYSEKVPQTKDFDVFLDFLIPEHHKSLKRSIKEQLAIQDKFDVIYDIQTFECDKYIRNRGRMVRDEFNKPKRIDGIISDVTQQVKMEHKQNLMSNVLQNQNDRLKNFAHIVSHNLRSHSGNISALIDLLLEDIPVLTENELVQLLKVASQNMTETIDNLSDVALVNINNNSLEKVHVNSILQQAIGSVKAKALQSHVQIINDLIGNEVILGIPAYLDSIFLNFLTNAIKYRDTNKQSFVRVSSERTNQFLVFSFQDNGLGIDMKRFSNRIFGMYKTFHGNADARGFGLFITKNQIEAMGGKVEVESKLGVGTTFKVFLQFPR